MVYKYIHGSVLFTLDAGFLNHLAHAAHFNFILAANSSGEVGDASCQSLKNVSFTSGRSCLADQAARNSASGRAGERGGARYCGWTQRIP